MRAYKCDICGCLYPIDLLYQSKDGVRVKFLTTASEPYMELCLDCAINVMESALEEARKVRDA